MSNNYFSSLMSYNFTRVYQDMGYSGSVFSSSNLFQISYFFDFRNYFRMIAFSNCPFLLLFPFWGKVRALKGLQFIIEIFFLIIFLLNVFNHFPHHFFFFFFSGHICGIWKLPGQSQGSNRSPCRDTAISLYCCIIAGIPSSLFDFWNLSLYFSKGIIFQLIYYLWVYLLRYSI